MFHNLLAVALAAAETVLWILAQQLRQHVLGGRAYLFLFFKEREKSIGEFVELKVLKKNSFHS